MTKSGTRRSCRGIDGRLAFVVCWRSWFVQDAGWPPSVTPISDQLLEMHDDEIFDEDDSGGGRADRARHGGKRPEGNADAMGAVAGHGIRLRQGWQDVFLQDGHQQRQGTAEGC